MSTPHTAVNSRLIHLTDTKGQPMLPEDDRFEPQPGSIVLNNGLWGTAWQLFFSDMRWHPTRGGGSKSWEELLKMRNLVLVYDADARPVADGGV